MLHMDGNKLIQKEHWADKEATIIHEIKDDEWTAVSIRPANLNGSIINI